MSYTVSALYTASALIEVPEDLEVCIEDQIIRDNLVSYLAEEIKKTLIIKSHFNESTKMIEYRATIEYKNK